MKKLIVSIGTAVLMFCASGVFAQAADQANPVAKGNLVVKLFDMGYSFARSGDLFEGDDADIIGINDSYSGLLNDAYFPAGTEVNYFVIDGLALGGSIHYAKTESKTGDKVNIWSIGPSVYYYFNFGAKILPYAAVSYIYSNIKSGDTMEWSLTRIPVGAGATFMIGEHIGVYGQLSYSFIEKDDGSTVEDGSKVDLCAGFKAFF